MFVISFLLFSSISCSAADGSLNKPVYHKDFLEQLRGDPLKITGYGPGYPPPLSSYRSNHENATQLAMRGMPAGPGCPDYCSECYHIYRFFFRGD